MLGIMLAAVWYWYYRDPSEHPHANQEERDYIAAHGARIEENDSEAAAQVR
ncbi:hypothetical protein [Kribbella shirazensis]|uniref:Cbb3-type cytochrome oxidase subunit 3 n=1 Tax=Kribbella shirazensis TaxID=1105143 RepID=A0A7X5VFA5_9ACTN|nr:hypothetical protein [Kribbella shirazensis]NIK59716.1 cbb3-type cytochrome oxidase subunit 3 [Kribbella shirazensis]